MSHDLHQPDGQKWDTADGVCAWCKKPMHKAWKYTYGSNACKQAAYRARQNAMMDPDNLSADAVRYRAKRNRIAYRRRVNRKGGAA